MGEGGEGGPNRATKKKWGNSDATLLASQPLRFKMNQGNPHRKKNPAAKRNPGSVGTADGTKA